MLLVRLVAVRLAFSHDGVASLALLNSHQDKLKIELDRARRLLVDEVRHIPEHVGSSNMLQTHVYDIVKEKIQECKTQWAKDAAVRHL